jgi:predicted ArsR family transcriptional regulator
MSEIENHILDILDANPQGLDHEKLARQVKAVANVQTGTINIAISTLERNGRISKGLGIRYQIVRQDKSARKTPTAAEREEQVLAGFAAESLLTINEITDVLALDRSSVDVIVKRMIEKGLIADSGQTQGLGPGRAAILYKRINQSSATAAGAAATAAATTAPTSIALGESLDKSDSPLPDKERVWQCFTRPKSARDVAEEIGIAANKVSGHVHWLLNAGRLKVALSTDLSTGGRHYLQSELTDPSAIQVQADASIHDEQLPTTALAGPVIAIAETGKGVISVASGSLLSSIPEFTKGGVYGVGNFSTLNDYSPRLSMPDTTSNSNFIIAPSRVSVFEKGKPDDAIHIEVETPTGGGVPFVRIWGGDDGVEDALTLTLAELDAVTGAARTLLKQREEATA